MTPVELALSNPQEANPQEANPREANPREANPREADRQEADRQEADQERSERRAPAFTTADWAYWRIYPGSFALLDPALRSLVAPARARVVERLGWSPPGSGRRGHWFFLRYFDGRGPHLRLRFAATLAELAELEAVVEDVLLEGLSALDRSSVPRGTYVGFDQAVYEPELGKYGGDAGLERSYPVFEHSSELAMRVVVGGRSAERYAYATLLTAAAVTAVLGEDATGGFLDAYKAFWSGQGVAEARSMLTRVERVAATRAEVLLGHAVTMATGDLGAAGRAYVEVVRTQLAGWSAGAGRPPAEQLLFNYVHLMNNRLGVRPWEEAVVADCLLRAGRARRTDIVSGGGA